MQYGGAAAGMRTMLDALLPAVASLERGGDAAAAAAAAAAGADATMAMDAEAGRANYVPAEQLKATPDPGAKAVAFALAAIATAIVA